MDLPHGNVLQNALFHLVQPIVIPVQHSPRLIHIGALLGLLAPGHFQTNIQIVADHRRLSAAVGLLGKPHDLLHQLLLDLLGNLELFDFITILLDLLVAVVPQLVLQHLHLLPQDHVLLHAPHSVADFFLHLHFQRDHIQLMGQDLVHQLQPFHGVHLLQDTLAIRVAKIDGVSYVVSQLAGVIAIQHRCHDLVRQLRHHVPVFAKQKIGLAHHSLHPAGHPDGEFVLQQHHVGLQEGMRLPQALDASLSHAPHHHANGRVRRFNDLQHMRHRAHGVQVAFLGTRHSQLPLGHQKNVFSLFHGVVQRQHGDLALHIKSGRLLRKNR